jgi:Uma2 family endonuclease
MVYTRQKFKTIEEYAALDISELPECRFELVDGEIIEMSTEADLNVRIAMFLTIIFSQFVPYYLLRRGTQVEVKSASVTCRDPDLMVVNDACHGAIAASKRSIIKLTMPNPDLVIEVVSRGAESSGNYQRDYIAKTQEYAARGIPEYWRIDPGREVVAVLTLKGKAYQVDEFRGQSAIASPRFPALTLTAQDILGA